MEAPTFLTIHHELRDLIYTIYLTTPTPLPPLSVTRADRFSRRDRFFTYSHWPWAMDTSYRMDDCIKYRDPTTNPVIPASLPLLLCNRQINAEVSSIITFLTNHTKQLQYEIDCEIVNEVDLYPTWLHIPVHFKEDPIPCLYANFRISGQLEPEKRSGWPHGCGGPGMMVWALMELLNRFLEKGPNLIPSRPDVEFRPEAVIAGSPSTSKSAQVVEKIKVLKNRIFNRSGRSIDSPKAPFSSATVQRDNHASKNIRIEKLIINFGPEELASTYNHYSPSDEEEPIMVVRFVQQHLEYLFSGSQSTLEYAHFIALRVGSVHLLCDGEEIAKWNLAESELVGSLP